MPTTETVKVEVYGLDGGSETVEIPRTKQLKDLQRLVGGNIEMVVPRKVPGMLEDDEIFLVNEEGLLHGMKQNPSYPIFVGPVIKMKDEDFD